MFKADVTLESLEFSLCSS